MRRSIYLAGVLALLLAPTAAPAQQPPGPFSVERPLRGPGARQGPGAAALRRQQLQQQVAARFMDRAQQRLGLSPADRQRLEQVIRANEVQRRELAREARQVRRQLVLATHDSTTPPAAYDRLLARVAELRQRDLALWQSEQAQLATVLTPRQRAQFMAMRLEFAELVQRMRQQRAAARNQGDPGTP